MTNIELLSLIRKPHNIRMSDPTDRPTDGPDRLTDGPTRPTDRSDRPIGLTDRQTNRRNVDTVRNWHDENSFFVAETDSKLLLLLRIMNIICISELYTFKLLQIDRITRWYDATLAFYNVGMMQVWSRSWNEFDVEMTSNWLFWRMHSWRDAKLTRCRVDTVQSWHGVELTRYRVDRMQSWHCAELARCRVDTVLTRCRVDRMQGWHDASPKSFWLEDSEQNIIVDIYIYIYIYIYISLGTLFDGARIAPRGLKRRQKWHSK